MKNQKSLTSILEPENHENIKKTISRFNYNEKILFLKKKLILLNIIQKTGCKITKSLRYKIKLVLKDININKFIGLKLDKEFLKLENEIIFYLKKDRKRKRSEKLKIKNSKKIRIYKSQKRKISQKKINLDIKFDSEKSSNTLKLKKNKKSDINGKLNKNNLFELLKKLECKLNVLYSNKKKRQKLSNFEFNLFLEILNKFLSNFCNKEIENSEILSEIFKTKDFFLEITDNSNRKKNREIEKFMIFLKCINEN